MTDPTPRKPNIIWYFGDQMRAQAVSHIGDPNVDTPNIDRLATEGGLTFTNAVAGNPWCTPFRGSLLTSRYSHVCCPKTPSPMDPQWPTIADAFNDAGYHTAYFGKWHVDGSNDGPPRHIVPPERRGRFKQWVGYENNNSQYDCHVHGHDAAGNEVPISKLPGYETDALTDLLLDYIDERGEGKPGNDQPFFAVCSVQPPHWPYVAPAEFKRQHNPARLQLRPNVPPVQSVETEARRRLAGYYAMIENIDWNLGRLYEKLEAAGQLHDTIIIFFSDHGDCLGSHGKIDKSQPWEESIRIPFTIGGGRPYHGKRTGYEEHAPLNVVDIAPTTLGLAGIEQPDWMGGFDYSGHWQRGQTGPLDGEPDSAYLQHLVRKRGVTSMDRAWRGIVTRDRWKYVCIPHAPYLMVNLNDDPYEMHNVALDPAYADKRAELQGRLARWIEETGDVFDLPEL